MNTEARVRALAAVPLFRNFDEARLERLAQLLEVRDFTQGSVIFYEHDAGDAMYFVEVGRVRISTHDAAVKQVTLAEIEHGYFFGEMAVIDGAERSASATALEDCRLLRLSRESFHEFVVAEPLSSLSLLASLSERLRNTNKLVSESVARNVNETAIGRMTFGERVADKVATFGGSWTFIFIFGSILVSWIGLNLFLAWRVSGRFNGEAGAFDPFPFIFLNLMLSTISAFQAPIIMMSQNRSSEKDRLAAENDYRVNLKSELLLEELTRRIERLQNVQIEEVLRRTQPKT